MLTHKTVFLELAVDFLNVQANAWYVDATFGGGGHSKEIIARGGKVLAFEYDSVTYKEVLPAWQKEIATGQLILVQENFAHWQKTITQLPQFGADFKFAGALFDLGTNSDQLQSGARGLSFAEDGPLDMRLDANLGVTARDLLLALSEKQIAQMLFEAGGEQEAKRLARAIVTYRQQKGEQAFLHSRELSDLISKNKHSRSHLHPATKTFQALRITVNGELDNLETALPQTFASLQLGGRLVTIAFHEGEDRPVKHFMQNLSQTGRAQLLTKKPIVPSDTELENPRARSAKLRALEKLKN
ncbi:MAG: 16S rRNA (cytosine(1402)-N(4))-methyltransferase RsmH [bacterium]|nr:16S rRNA (cytosine(1402)-N(4))-methyltransferase RsmH [bacterium]